VGNFNRKIRLSEREALPDRFQRCALFKNLFNCLKKRDNDIPDDAMCFFLYKKPKKEPWKGIFNSTEDAPFIMR